MLPAGASWCWDTCVGVVLKTDPDPDPNPEASVRRAISDFQRDMKSHFKSSSTVHADLGLADLKILLQQRSLQWAEGALQVLLEMACSIVALQDGSQEDISSPMAAALLKCGLIQAFEGLHNRRGAAIRPVFSASLMSLLNFLISCRQPVHHLELGTVPARLITSGFKRYCTCLPFKEASTPLIIEPLPLAALMSTGMAAINLVDIACKDPNAQTLENLSKALNDEGYLNAALRVMGGIGLALSAGAGALPFCCKQGVMEAKLLRLLLDVTQTLPQVLATSELQPILERSYALMHPLWDEEVKGWHALRILRPAFAVLLDIPARVNLNNSEEGLLPALLAHTCLAHLLVVLLKSLAAYSEAMALLGDVNMRVQLAIWPCTLAMRMSTCEYAPLLQRMAAIRDAPAVASTGSMLLQMVELAAPKSIGPLSAEEMRELSVQMRRVIMPRVPHLLGMVMMECKEGNNRVEAIQDLPVPGFGHLLYGCYHATTARPALPYSWLRSAPPVTTAASRQNSRPTAQPPQQGSAATSKSPPTTAASSGAPKGKNADPGVRAADVPDTKPAVKKVGKSAGSQAAAKPQEPSTGQQQRQQAAAAAPAGSSVTDSGETAAEQQSPGGAKARACSSCGTAAPANGKLQRCGGCMAASYCSVECQKAHWRAGHKAECGKGVTPAASASAAAGHAAAAESSSTVDAQATTSAPSSAASRAGSQQHTASTTTAKAAGSTSGTRSNGSQPLSSSEGTRQRGAARPMSASDANGMGNAGDRAGPGSTTGAAPRSAAAQPGNARRDTGVAAAAFAAAAVQSMQHSSEPADCTEEEFDGLARGMMGLFERFMTITPPEGSHEEQKEWFAQQWAVMEEHAPMVERYMANRHMLYDRVSRRQQEQD